MGQTYDPGEVPAAVGGYANAVEIPDRHRLLFVSGQIPESVDGVVPENAEDQCRLIWSHIVACLEAAGMGVANLVKITTFLSSRDLASVNTAVRRSVLGGHRPALTVIVADTFDERWKLEIEVIAAAPV